MVARYLSFVVESFWGRGGGLSFIQEKELGAVGESYPGPDVETKTQLLAADSSSSSPNVVVCLLLEVKLKKAC